MASDFSADNPIHALRDFAELHSDAIGANGIVESDFEDVGNYLEDAQLDRGFPFKDGNGNVVYPKE